MFSKSVIMNSRERAKTTSETGAKTMETLALRIFNETKDGKKITIENETIFGKAAMLAVAYGYIRMTATSPGHTTYVSAR